MNKILADISVSVTEIKRDLAAVLRGAAGAPVAVLNHNQPMAYLLSAEQYESLLNKLDDMEDACLVMARRNEPVVKVDLNEL